MAKKVDAELDVASSGFVEEYCTKPYEDADGVQVASGIGRDGKEYPDPVPMAPPVGYSAPPDLMQMIRTMVHSEMANRVIDEAGWDTFDEAGDFDIADDPLEPLTPWEMLLQPQPQGNRPQDAAPSAAPASVVTPSQPVAASAEAGVASPPPGNAPPSNSTST